MRKLIFHTFISNQKFFIFNQRFFSILLGMTLFFLVLGFCWGFAFSPIDYQQGVAFRIIYVHVPAAFWSLSIYTFMFLFSVIFLVWRIKLFDILASESAMVGALYTLIALLTGMLWGKPMWGTFWVFDARLTSELILLFLFLGYLGLRHSIEDQSLRAKLSGLLAIIGMSDVPIVHFSVKWWHTLHQGPTIAHFKKPLMSTEMLFPLIILFIGFGLFYLLLLSLGTRAQILARENKAHWIQKVRNNQSEAWQGYQITPKESFKVTPS